MSNTASLLPVNRTPLEAAIERVSLPTADPAVIRTIHSPQQAPAPLLPWLAWSHDVPIWPVDADEVEQRSMIERSEYYHRIAGTLEGFRTMARLAGGKLVGVVRPPAKTFAAPALTTDERNQWVNRHPEIRWYRYRDRSTRQHAVFGRRDYLGAMHPAITDAIDRVEQRAFLIQNGQETPVTHHVTEVQTGVKDSIETHAVALTSSRGHATWLGRFTRYLADNGAAKRLYSVTLDDAYIDRQTTLRRQTIAPSMRPISVLYDTIAQRSTRRAALFGAGDFLGARCLAVTDAATRLYRSIRLHDTNLRPERRGRSTHLGATRLGMPHHNGELTVELQDKAAKRRTYINRYVSGHLVTSSQARLRQLLDALRFARRASEKIGVTTKTHSPLGCSTRHLSGDLLCGQWS